MKTHWTRPYPPGGGRWLVIAWEAASITALGWTSDRLFGFDTGATVIFSLILAAAWAVGAVRIARMGVYVAIPASGSAACSGPARSRGRTSTDSACRT